MAKTHFQKLERMYLSAPCNNIYNPSVHIGDGKAKITIQIKNEFYHAAGAVHGSTYFKMLDDAAYFSTNSLVNDVFMLTANFNIHLLRPVTQGRLTAKGTVLSQAGKQIIAESVLFDKEENKIAVGSGAFIKSKTPLSEDIGYK